MQTQTWYSQIIKPSFAPPAEVFGPVWTVLYVLIAISFIYVFYKAWKKELPALIALPFALNIIFNLLYSPIQFGLQNNLLAAIDILLILGTLLWVMVVIYPKIRWVFYMNIPYLLWVLFATVLQISVTALNWA